MPSKLDISEFIRIDEIRNITPNPKDKHWMYRYNSEPLAKFPINFPIPYAREEVKRYLRDEGKVNVTIWRKGNPEPELPKGYGVCPTCKRPSISRERRIDGNDTCENGHVYPSKDAIVK